MKILLFIVGIAAILAASLELAREGFIAISQKNSFQEILIKQKNE